MKSAFIRAEQYKHNATGAEQGALNYILEHPDNIPKLSVKQLSALSYSSGATIIRLCRKLGFEGYRDFQNSLLSELVVREKERSNHDIGGSEDEQMSDIIEKVTYRNMTSLKETMKIVDTEAIEEAVEYICSADSILLFGLGASLLVAQDAYLKFIRISKPCSCCEDIHSQYVLAKTARPTDVAVIISYSGYTQEMVRCADYLITRGTPIIAITRFDSSPISQRATCNLYVVASEELYRSGAMSSRISQLNVIDVLYPACVNRNLSQNLVYFAQTQIDKGQSSVP